MGMIKIEALLPSMLLIPSQQITVLMLVSGMIKTIVLRDVSTTMVGAALTILGLCQVQTEIRNTRAGF